MSAAAAELHARAFTVGADIFLGEGESPADLELMAHEATHVVQQQAVAVYRDLEVTDLAPDCHHRRRHRRRPGDPRLHRS